MKITKPSSVPTQMTVFSDGDKEMTMTPIRSYTLLQTFYKGLMSMEPQTGWQKAWVEE
jgi:hypothetical protein